MAIPPWTIDLLRRGLSDVAKKAREPEVMEKIKNQASEILQDFPQSAARSIDAVMRTADTGRRSVQRWARQHTTVAVPMLNASGTLLTERGTGVPLADAVTEIGCELIGGDTVGGSEFRQRIQRRLDRCLPDASGQSVAIAHRLEAAVAAITLIGDNREIVIHRSQAIGLAGGQSLPDVLVAALASDGQRKLSEVGSSNRAVESDFGSRDHFITVLADDGSLPVAAFDFDGRDVIQVAVLPIATLGRSDRDDQIPSVESVLAAGADVVVFSGQGIAGGPACGILVGPKDLVHQIQACPAWASLAASEATIAMMTVALEITSSSTPVFSSSTTMPIESLLATSAENLKGRAERMAIRLTADDGIAHCQVTADDAGLTSGGRWKFPSRQLRLRHHHRSATEWAKRLRADIPSVLAAVDGDDLVIDLRWIAAADDGKLATALGGHGDSSAIESPTDDSQGTQAPQADSIRNNSDLDAATIPDPPQAPS
ncbi:L-seryl-tRNA(Sec) selenium transferase [Rubripirellula lacrimiformis]|uniref:L-seryl-tRNA(Sec) selenium transferase n=1 Tax=Rubripirellula lacrimiformis TaxID=1930273 RepID=A0A517NAY8_9BACT|nr:hypothetical protein [Rubripirellula lacrimiformis]QDT04178.1 L-seryl-tRNA(Sec) selenium transferase [Rubripirellula lacrimiformis]